MKLSTSALICSLGVFFCASTSVANTVVFFEDFENENGGQTALDYNRFSQFTGLMVDLAATPDFGVTCAGGGGLCVDLSNNAGEFGTLTSNGIAVSPGPYEFSFDYSGSQTDTGPPRARAAVRVIGTMVSDEVSADYFDPFRRFSVSFFVPTASTLALQFECLESSGQCIFIDNVQLAAVPIPAPVFLFGSAMIVIGICRRHARRIA
ncbi:MAG: hypothetical protein AAF493_15730 [Pseudomonadota bacterium]